MNFLTILTIISTVFAAKTFSVITIRSGSKFQYLSISSVDGRIYVGGNSNIDFLLNDDDSLTNTRTGKFINVEHNFLIEADEAIAKFKIQDNYLYSLNTQGFYACPIDDDSYYLGLLECNKGTPIALRVGDVTEVVKEGN